MVDNSGKVEHIDYLLDMTRQHDNVLEKIKIMLKLGEYTMLIEVIVKLVIYFVVITLVQLMMKKLKNSESVITQQDVVIINEKVISKILLSVAIVYSILVITISTLPLNISGKTLCIVAIFVIALNIVLYLLGLHYYFYKIELSSEGIYFRTGIIKKYRYSWKQVLSFEVTNNNKIIINCEKKES